MSPGPLLAVHAHPDDETLWTGALLATWARSGAPVTLVTCTRGEQGEVIPRGLAHLEGAGPALAAHREQELAEAAGALGIADHHVLDEDAVGGPWPGPPVVDSGMAWLAEGRAGAGDQAPPEGALVTVPVEDAARRVAALVAQVRPAVVVGCEPGGGYGHPDHVRAHEVMMRAVAQAVEEGLPEPVVLWAVVDRSAWREAADALAADGDLGRDLRSGGPLRAVDPAAGEPSAVVDHPGPGVAVDVAPVLPAVLAAMRAHATQVQAVVAAQDPAAQGHAAQGHAAQGHAAQGPSAVPPARFALSNGVVQPVLAQESYRCAQGDLASVAWPAGVRVVGRRPPDAG